MTKAILYLHGFQSSPFSFKAQLISRAVENAGDGFRYFCPQLPLSPDKSIEIASDTIRGYPAESLVIIGSSLGGYYANWLAEQYRCKAILLNPVIDPWRIKILDDLPDRSDLRVREWLDFREKYQSELEAVRVTSITDPERDLLFAAKGDELLDWHLMQSHYQAANQIIIEGSDHGLSDFAQYLERVLLFCGIRQ